MDITSFINSKDIREYHKQIGYEYNSVEAAWLVSQCNSKTLEQKHEAWLWIIDNMPDMEIKDCGRWDGHFRKREEIQANVESIHKLLRDYMEMEDAFIKEFEENTGGWFYTYKYYYSSFKYRCGSSDLVGFFSTYEKCVNHIQDNVDAEDSNLIEIKRTLPDEGDVFRGDIMIDLSGRIMEVSPNYSESENKRWYEIDGFFDELWFCFPVPFKRGDIVSICNRYHPEDREPIVIDGIIVPHGWDEEEYTKKRRDHGDTSDMNIWGYAANVEWVGGYRSVYSEVWWNYMDAEYYSNELKGNNRVLKPVSNWLKGELGDALDLLLAGYHHIVMEEYLAETVPSLYTKEGLEKAGFPAEGDE